MRTWRQRIEHLLEHIQGTVYAPGMSLPDEVAALGARIVTEPDGSETLITAEKEVYPLTEGGIITIRRDKVGYNTRERLERKYEEVPEPATPPDPKVT